MFRTAKIPNKQLQIVGFIYRFKSFFIFSSFIVARVSPEVSGCSAWGKIQIKKICFYLRFHEVNP
ncbi:hypothetical protein B0A64_01250 [Flavobacterium araucananum]|uniref:Uncharacterized protein n=1 Tax=Flavobacterium araucananum TaxID=946678 RepID=A0A227PK40_9FLAO|nr:hypothetical protein B0A64_01250 [Flavobacterium araucananum]